MLTLYEVTGRRRYRGHSQGDEFVARLEPDAESRAVARGDVRVIERFEPALPANHELPSGWAEQRTTTEGSG